MAVALSGSAAFGHGAAERPLARLPPAPPGDGAKAEQILRDVAGRVAAERGKPADNATSGQKTAKASAVRVADVVAAPVEQAKKALARAHGARTAGDARHARLLDGLALEWAETARDLLRAADQEAKALEEAQRAREIETQLERARALLAETQARRGRAAAELERLEAEARDAVGAAAAAEQARVEASKKGGVKAAGEKGEASKQGGQPAKPQGGQPAKKEGGR
jgi:hypothetical protein